MRLDGLVYTTCGLILIRLGLAVAEQLTEPSYFKKEVLSQTLSILVMLIKTYKMQIPMQFG